MKSKLENSQRQVGCSYIAVALIEVDKLYRHFTHNRVNECHGLVTTRILRPTSFRVGIRDKIASVSWDEEFPAKAGKKWVMRARILSTGLRANLTVLIATLFVTVTCASAQERVLHSFHYTNGANSLAGLISDASGNFYGTTLYGGTDGDGTVFKLTPEATGTVLYSFNSPGADGHWPIAGLNFDACGNLFGTTEMGGTEGYGAVFELTSAASGGWTERVLHSFNNNGQDGTYPRAGLIVDASGHLCGTTTGGGTDGYGMVFELTQAAGGAWTRKGAAQFQQRGRGRSLRQPNLRCSRKSVRDDFLRWRLQQWYGLRVDPKPC